MIIRVTGMGSISAHRDRQKSDKKGHRDAPGKRVGLMGSEMTVCADATADIFPALQIASIDSDPIKEDKNNENIIHRFARNIIADSNITILRG
jgi:hypothetical protein